MNNIEKYLNNIYYPMDPIYDSMYDDSFLIGESKKIYYLVYDDKEDIKYATLGLIFSLATLSSLIFLVCCCNTDEKKPYVHYRRLKRKYIKEPEVHEVHEVHEKDEES